MTDTSITPFLFEGEALVRVMQKGDTPWFVAADVCKLLGIAKHRDAVSRLDDDERGSVEVDTLGGRQEMSAVNESGLYTLILRCRDAVTPGTIPHRVRKWVTSEVLPSIRKTGAYTPVTGTQVIHPMPEQVRDIALNLRIITEDRQSFGCKASQQMWFKLGMDVVPAMLDGGEPNLFTYQAVTGQNAAE